MDVVGIGVQPVADGKGHHFSIDPEESALKSQRMKVIHCRAQGDSLISQVPLFSLPLPLKRAAIPLLVHGQTLRKALRRNLFIYPGGVVFYEAVDVVPLGMELLARQIR